MGIQQDSRHKRRATGGKRASYRKHRKFLLGRPQAKTKLGEPRVRRIRVRGGNHKLRALRLDSGIFSWSSEGISRKTRILGVVYNGANNEFVRTNTLVRGEIVQIDAAPFRLWYEAHYGVGVGRKIPAVKATKRLHRAEGEELPRPEKKKKNPKRIYFKFAPKAVLNKIKAYKARKARAIVRAAARAAAQKSAAPKDGKAPAKPVAAPKKAAAKPAAPKAAAAKAGAKPAASKAAAAKKPAAAGAKKAAAAKKPEAPKKADASKKAVAAPKKPAAKKPEAPKKPADAAAKKPADAAAKKSAAKKPAAKKPAAKKSTAAAAKAAVETRSRSVILKLKRRAKVRALESHFEEQFVGGRLLAAITSRPGQTGRIDGYLLEGKELEFYVKKTQKKKRN